MLISFDFDDTLLLTRFDPDWGGVEAGPNEVMLQKLRDHVDQGDRVIIVTTRNERHSKRVHEFVATHGLDIAEIHFTAGQDKAETLLRLGVDIHHDDDPHELALLPDSIEGVKAPIHPSWG